MKSLLRRRVVIPALILCAGAGLRLLALGSNDFWYDEIHSIRLKDYISSYTPAAGRFYLFSPGQTTSFELPVYYSFLSWWSKLFPEDEFSLRLLSALFGVLCIAAVYCLGRSFADAGTGEIAAFLLAVSPLHIWYSQELRPYTLSALLAVIAVFFFLRALRTQARRYWFMFALTSFLLIATHYVAAALVASTGFVFFRRQYRQSFYPWLVSCALAAVCLSPFAPFILRIFGLTRGTFWIARPECRSFALAFAHFNLGYNADSLQYLVSLPLFGGLAFSAMRDMRRSTGVFTLSCVLFFTLFLILLVSLVSSLFLSRYFLMLVPLYYCLIAAGIRRFSGWQQALILASLALFISVPLGNYYRGEIPAFGTKYSEHVAPKTAYKPAVRYVEQNRLPGDVVAHTNLILMAPFEYYSHESQYFFVVTPVTPFSWLNIEASRKENPGSVIEVEACGTYLAFPRIWLVSGSWNRGRDIDGNSASVKERLQRDYSLAQSREFDGLFVDLYVRKPDGRNAVRSR